MEVPLKRRRLSAPQVIAIGFAGLLVFGTLLLSLPISNQSGKPLSFIDSLFSAAAALCVTGLSAVQTGVQFTLFGQVVLLLLVQIGGLGFMTAATTVLLAMHKRISLRERLVLQEQLNAPRLQGVVKLVIRVLTFTLVFESIGALLLSLRFVPLYGVAKGIYYAVFHSVSAFCNAGITLFGAPGDLSFFRTDPLVSFTVMGLVGLGGLGFSVIGELCRREGTGRKPLSLHTRIVLIASGGLFLATFIYIFMAEYANPATLAPLTLPQKLMASAFSAVAPRTAGFYVFPPASFAADSLLLILVNMFIGGSPGSTAGGIKITTAAIIVMAALSHVRGREEVVVAKRRIPPAVVSKAFAVMVLSLGTVLAVTLLMGLFEGGRMNTDFPRYLFEATGAFATAGMSLNLTPTLGAASKLLLCAVMFAGRLGPLTLSIAISRRPKINDIQYPEERINVG